jgi:hypothetical protein
VYLLLIGDFAGNLAGEFASDFVWAFVVFVFRMGEKVRLSLTPFHHIEEIHNSNSLLQKGLQAHLQATCRNAASGISTATT